MNTCDTLAGQLRRNPDEPALRCMLIDALIEEQFIDAKIATRSADHIISDARNARGLAEAAAVLATAGTLRHAVHDRVRQELRIPADVSFTVLLVEGNSVPTITGIRNAHAVGSYWPHTTITCGAEWLLRAA